MKRKRIKSKNKDIGFISGNGICIDGDILMNCEKEHTAGSYLWMQILLTFVATLCTAAMGSSFLNMGIYWNTLLYYSAMLSVVFGLLKSKHGIVRFSALAVTIVHLLYMLSNLTNIKYGFYVVIDRYLSLANQPNSTLGVQLNGIDRIDYPYFATNFFVPLITLLALGISAACIYRIDFPLLFIITFPIFELGMYWGWEPAIWSVLGLFICWVVVLSMHAINHTTNKAGKKNTFAVHERKRTFYFTSDEKKACFYSVYMKFVGAVCAVILAVIILFSLITGFTRPDSFDVYRRNISTAIANFSLSDLRNAFSDYDGGFDLFGIKTVGGTNGGILGKTAGISFNGSTAMKIETAPFNGTLYLKGYVAGVYKDNCWTPVEVDDDEVEFDDYFDDSNLWVQDMNYDVIEKKYGSRCSSKEISVSVLGASKKFVYAPYSALYTSDGNTGSERMKPTTESYVKLSSTKYSLYYYNPLEISNVPEAIPESISAANGQFSDDERSAFDDYTKFVNEHYLDVSESEALDEAYEVILNQYLGGSYNDGIDWSFYEVSNAIKNYFSDNFTYTLEPGVTPEDEDFVEYFLSVQKEGYCSYYATAGVQLLRKFGFPARYVEGYMILSSQLGDTSGQSSTYQISVKDKSAHAWAEVYIEGAGWYPVEFTPGYDNDNPNLSEQEKNPDKATTSVSKTETKVSEVSQSAQSGNAVTTKPDNNSGSKASTTTKKSPGKGNIADSAAPNGGSDSSGVSVSVKPTEPQAVDKNSGIGRGMLISILGITLIVAAIFVHRKVLLNKMNKALYEDKDKERAMSSFGYMLKYFKLINIYGGSNVTDSQLCDEIIERCREKDITSIDDKLRFVCELAIKAHLSNSVITKDEADKSAEILDEIRKDIILPRLSTLELLSAKFIYCLY